MCESPDSFMSRFAQGQNRFRDKVTLNPEFGDYSDSGANILSALHQAGHLYPHLPPSITNIFKFYGT